MMRQAVLGLIFSSCLLFKISFGIFSASLSSSGKFVGVYTNGDGVITWYDAQQYCFDEYDADLATITSASENQEALDAVLAAGGSSDQDAWIGYNDIDTEGTFVWADGSTSTYNNWADNEPNNCCLVQTNNEGEDCVHFYTSDGEWNDLPCDPSVLDRTSHVNFVCGQPRDCSVTDICCRAWGDPHITTWDDIYYHPQGEGYKLYVTSCEGGVDLPFEISALQERCNGAFTCVREVIITLPSQRIRFPSNSAPTDVDTNNVVSGTFSFDDGTNSGTYTVSTYNFALEYDDGSGRTLKIQMGYKGTTLKLATSECLHNQLCGLCGYFDGDDGSNDFTRCDDGTEIDSSGTSSFRGMSADAWTRTNDFGDSCCDRDLDEELRGVTECPDTDEEGDARQPDEDCLDAASELCNDAYTDLCDCSGDIEPAVDEDSFVSSCEIDVCALADENGLTPGEVGDLSLDDALDGGYLDTSLSKCEVDCDTDGNIDTDEPSNSPTEEPLILT